MQGRRQALASRLGLGAEGPGWFSVGATILQVGPGPISITVKTPKNQRSSFCMVPVYFGTRIFRAMLECFLCCRVRGRRRNLVRMPREWTRERRARRSVRSPCAKFGARGRASNEILFDVRPIAPNLVRTGCPRTKFGWTSVPSGSRTKFSSRPAPLAPDSACWYYVKLLTLP